MPTFSMSDALREALSIVRTDVIEYYTFEFWHEDWEEPARIVSGWDQIEARLEAAGDADDVQIANGTAGELVTFYPVPIEFTMPSTLPDETPTFEFKFHDLQQIVMQKILQNQVTPKKVLMFIRVYLSSNLNIGPETIPVPRYNVASLKLSTAASLITGRCMYNDFIGRSVPFRSYTYAEYPDLRR